jgi:hypothetical protein
MARLRVFDATRIVKDDHSERYNRDAAAGVVSGSNCASKAFRFFSIRRS